MTGPDHGRWADAAGAYLLGALEPAESAGYEEHLERCEACRAEVDGLRVAAEALPASAPQFAPPPELKDRIMAVVRSEAELLRAAGPDADRPAPVRPRRRLLPRLSLRPGLALAATLLVLAGGGLAGWALRSDGGDVQRTVLADVSASGARAHLLVRDEHSTLVTHGMPSPGEGHVYQVWLKRPGTEPEPTNALFDVRHGAASVDVPGELDGVEAVLVTVEPDGGSLEPSGPPVIAAALS